MLTPQFSDLARRHVKDSKKFEKSLTETWENFKDDKDMENLILETIFHSIHYDLLPYLKIIAKTIPHFENYLYFATTSKNPIAKAYFYQASFIMSSSISTWITVNYPADETFKKGMLTVFISGIYNAGNRLSNAQWIQLLNNNMIDYFSNQLVIFNFQIINTIKIPFKSFLMEMLKVDKILADMLIKEDIFDELLPDTIKDIFLF